MESRAVFRGVYEEAEKLGLLRPAGRALNNLGSTLYEEDPVQALEINESLRELAWRTGDLGWIIRSAHDIVWSYVFDGRYADALAVLDEFTDEERPEIFRPVAEYQRQWIDHLRGPTSIERVGELLEIIGQFENDPDPQVSEWFLMQTAGLHADVGQWEVSYQFGMRVDDSLALSGLYMAAEAAAWTHNHQWLDAIADRLAASSQSSSMLEGYLKASRLALSGDLSAASEAFGDLLESETRRLLGSHLTQIRATYALLVGQDDPRAAQAARDADEWLQRTATGTLRRLWAAGLPPEAQQTLAG